VNTVLPTGPGAWEKAAKGDPNPKKTVKVAMASAIPTPSHMALVKL
jgi:NAD-dependent histone deacetylase SIR2/mono-ADP-ribosyltransferase sirtuin 6